MRWILAALLAVFIAGGAAAQPRNVTLVVPFPPGGSADVVARLLAENMRTKGYTIAVENRSGAGGVIGTASVARAPADGSVMLLGQIGSQLLSWALNPNPGYHALNGFEPVALLGFVPTIFVVRDSVPATTLREFVEYARRANPPLAYGSSGPGTSTHITVEMLRSMAGIELTHIPYRGLAPTMQDLLAGQIAAMTGEAPGLLPILGHGARALAVLSPTRSPVVPDVPTTAEAGFPDWVMESWYGLFVPAAVPETTRAALERDVLEVVRQPAMQQALAARGLVGAGPASDFKPRLQQDFAAWPGLIQRLGIRAD
ncbi:Bug family tripartite tricarboxylate transporter substrate binding protein [Falsiroseomonas sp. HW251]|uniref:Bug family tripartite tricarboxylate transporter substrate binding protein n=1 Tax=Falsiroseomonas sp. HW251 TaxID=3390998 RepID=UPI003D30F515